ncbi:MAG: hydroxymethylglutaryl-CoA reductase, degradative [Candidatus Aenigmatarchaeota archaeon]
MRSDISGFHELNMNERLNIVKKFAKLTDKEIKLLKSGSCLNKLADKMIENVIGTIQLPIGIATNFLINGRDYLIPMAIEESSVVAAASHSAKLARPGGGFYASSDEPLMIGQIQIVGVKESDFEKIKKIILKNKNKIIEIANNKDSTMIKLGGGVRDIEIRKVKYKNEMFVVVHLIIDVRDAMGANCVNTMVECISKYLEELTGYKTRLKIVSNLAVKRLVRAKAIWKSEIIGKDLIDAILDIYHLSLVDPYRCSTHNKGIMNGIDAVAIATGNDFRALEAGAHAYACMSGKYQPLTKYKKNKNGDLVGEIELPVVVGIVGGATKINPIAQISLKILGVKSAQELAQIIACVGLANNFAAIRAIAKEGIQRGHMRLHATNIAVQAGAKYHEIDFIAKQLVQEGNISESRAKKLLREMRKNKNRIKM